MAVGIRTEKQAKGLGYFWLIIGMVFMLLATLGGSGGMAAPAFMSAFVGGLLVGRVAEAQARRSGQGLSDS